MLLDQIEVGAMIEIEPARIDEAEMLQFSNRYNPIPIHTDTEYAKNTKFGKVLASGVMSFLEVWANYVPRDFAGEDLIAGKSSYIEWFQPVFAGDILRGVAKVTKITPRNDYNGILQVTIDVYNQSDVLVLQNVTESIVRRK